MSEKPAFRDLLDDERVHLFDGAVGTLLLPAVSSLTSATMPWSWSSPTWSGEPMPNTPPGTPNATG